MSPLAGRVVLVTGGGSGLGRETCLALAAAGAAVGVGDVRVEQAERVAGEARALGGQALPLELDVRDDGSAQRAWSLLEGEAGPIDGHVNNAGVDVTNPADELTLAEWDAVVAVNLRGPFVLARLALPRLRALGGGDIVNVVSTAAKRAWPNAAAYHASKWGLLGLSHALHTEARPHGVRVTAVIAGGMRTPFLLDRFPDLDPGVLQEPRAVADAILFALGQPAGTVVPELTVLPLRETSWP
ncbi:MAG: SDR family NAD(P)-dependent oxidoreductase [Thermoleophilia bacterium]